MAGKSIAEYDVAIIGGGVTGTALLYVLSEYTNVGSIALIEKHPQLAAVNSNTSNNSQTLHVGDIETNYDLEKTRRVKQAAELVKTYIEKFDPHVARKAGKMVLAVGEREVRVLEDRYREIKGLFPSLCRAGAREIEEAEPEVMRGRGNEQVLALQNEGYIVDFRKLAESFAARAKKSGRKIDILLNEKATAIRNEGSGWAVEHSRIPRNGKTLTRAKVLVSAAGPHSLLLAQSAGYGREYAILPVAGSFYRAKTNFRGKVYTVQNPKLPFAAIHGDPSVWDPAESRLGPVSKVLPVLERWDWSTAADFAKVSVSPRAIASFFSLLFDRTIAGYIFANFLYELPLVGRWFFLRKARKIIPALKAGDLSYIRGAGGIRPQAVNIKTRKMTMGESKIIGDRAIFNITPSPGASVCLKTAENDARAIAEFLGGTFSFNDEKFAGDYQ